MMKTDQTTTTHCNTQTTKSKGILTDFGLSVNNSFTLLTAVCDWKSKKIKLVYYLQNSIV